MKRWLYGPAVALSCAALIAWGVLYPMEVTDRENRQTKADMVFGSKIELKLEQPFFSNRAGLAGLELGIINQRGRTFNLRIKGVSGKTESEASFNTALRGYEIIRFDPIKNSVGKRYTFEIDVPDSGPQIDFLGSGNETGKRELVINGKAAQAWLFYQPVYKLGPIEMAGLVYDRLGMHKPWTFSAWFSAPLHIALLAAVGGWAASFAGWPKSR